MEFTPELILIGVVGFLVSGIIQIIKKFKKGTLPKWTTRAVTFVVSVGTYYVIQSLAKEAWIPQDITSWITPLVAGLTPFGFYHYVASKLPKKK